MTDESKVPNYLQDTYDMLKCAFPDGVPENEYWALLSLLHAEMSFRTIGEVLTRFTTKEYIEIVNDASGFGLDPSPDVEIIETVKQKLLVCGYEQWLENE